MAGDFPPENDDDLTGIVRGDIGAPLPSPDLGSQSDLFASLFPWQSPLRQASLAALPRVVSPAPLSPWESPLRQAVDASQNANQSASRLRGTSTRELPSGGTAQATEPEKPITPGFAVWRGSSTFGSPRVQPAAEAPSTPVVSGVQEGLVRHATQTASSKVVGVVDGLLVTRELRPARLTTGSMCPDNMKSSSLARMDTTASCGCSPCQENKSNIDIVKNNFNVVIGKRRKVVSFGGADAERDIFLSDYKNIVDNIISMPKYKDKNGKLANVNNIGVKFDSSQIDQPKVNSNFESDLLWGDGIILYNYGYHYVFNSEGAAIGVEPDWPDDKMQLMEQAMREWEDVTNNSIKFQPSGSEDAVVYYYGDGDRSYTHREKSFWGDSTIIDIETKKGTATNSQLLGSMRHELGHVIGLTHEQQRADSNIFIQKLYEDPGKEKEQNEIKGLSVGPYNSRSVMQYGSNLAACLAPGNSYNNGTSCYICQPRFIGGDGGTLPDRLFCPDPFAPNAYDDQLNKIPFNVLISKNKGVISGGVLPNEPYSIIGPTNKIISLLDGAAVVEMYRLVFNKIPPFQPVFDPFLGGDNRDHILTDKFTKDPTIIGFVASTHIKNSSNKWGNEIALVVVTKDGHIFTRKKRNNETWTENWKLLTPVPGGAWSEPAITSSSQGVIDIVVVNNAGDIYYGQYEETYSNNVDWKNIGKTNLKNRQISRPAICSTDENLIDIFIISEAPRKLNHKRIISYIGPSGEKKIYSVFEWYPVDSTFGITSAPAVASLGNGQLVLAIAGLVSKDPNKIFLNNQALNGINVPGGLVSNIWVRIGGAITNCNATSSANGLFQWCAWTNSSGQIHLPQSNPAIGVSTTDGRFAIYVRGKYGHLIRYSFQPQKQWTESWWDLGGVLFSDPSVTQTEIFSLYGENLNDFFQVPTADPTDDTKLQITKSGDIKTLNLGIWNKKDIPF